MRKNNSEIVALFAKEISDAATRPEKAATKSEEQPVRFKERDCR